MASIDKFTLLALIRKVGLEGDVDFLREGLKVLAEALMDAEVSRHIGAERFERSENRKNYRNGYRSREWTHGSERLTLRSLNCEKAVTSPTGRLNLHQLYELNFKVYQSIVRFIKNRSRCNDLLQKTSK
jgi:transposase-like protein